MSTESGERDIHDKQAQHLPNVPVGEVETRSDDNLKSLSSEQKRVMLAKLLKKKSGKQKKTFPLSFAQQRLWFMDQLEPGNAFYNVPAILSLTGSIDAEALQKSLNEIVRRHEVLRSTIAMVDGQPTQMIEESIWIPLPLVDLQDQPYEQRQDAALRLAHEEVLKPFDLSTGPLIRARLLRLHDQEYMLLLMMHHIVSDGWSMDVFLREFTTLYRAFVHGEVASLPELPIQYADFAVWQRDWFQDENQRKHLDYWRQQLAELHDLELPTDRPRSAEQSYRGATQRFTIAKELADNLKALSQREGVSMFMTLLAVFNILLYRYTGQTDIGIGSAIANRNRKEVENLIGFFVNTLVLRTDLAGNPGFRQLLHNVRETVLTAYMHQDLPFEKLVEELQPERSLSRQPLFQVIFIFHNFPPPTLELPELVLTPITVETGTAKFDLQLAIIDTQDGLNCWLEYSTDLFDASTIQQLQEHLRVLLAAVVAAPEQSIATLPLLAPAETEQLRLEWTVSTNKGAQETDIFQQIVRQSVTQPAAVAISSTQVQLRYAELVSRTNQLAHYLNAQGVTSGTIVALSMIRSVERVIAQLALLQVGAICLSLAPEAPIAYLASQLAAVHAVYVLTQPDMSERLAVFELPLLLADLNSEKIVSQPETELRREVQAGEVVALLSSAGSFVAFERVVLSQQLNWLHQQFSLTSADVLLHTSLPEAEHDLWSLCWPLVNGGQIVLPTNEELESPLALQHLINEHKISILNLTATTLKTVALARTTEMQSLRLILCNGGDVPFEEVQAMPPRFPGKLYALYNLPECGTCFFAPLEAVHLSASSEQIQGYAAHSSLILLDDYQQVVPEGIYADLYVKYLDSQGEKLQKIGYRGRYLGQGSFALLDRPERILRRNGLSISLDEIQASLLAHPAIDDAVVLMRPRQPNVYELVAYIVPVGPFVPQRIRAILEQNVPESMVPDHFVPLATLPLTKAGRVDEAHLLSFDVTDLAVLNDWQQRVNALPEVERVALIAQEYIEPVPVLHLSDLLPGWRAGMSTDAVSLIETAAATEPQLAEDEASIVMAWSDGGPLSVPEEKPTTLTAALLHTATVFKDKGITHVQPDGSTLFQSYPLLLEEAKRILAGLHQLGFKQGDTAMLQIENWRYHFSTFWACVLAGITPVTVAVAHSYAEKNGIVNKLYNTWELLDHPPILANEHIVSSLKGLNSFLPMSNLQVLSIEHLLKNEPSEEIYPCHPEDRVFFQLTSGSTGVPKCIQVTHRGIIAHIHGAQQFNDYSSDDISLNWLPTDHVAPMLTYHLRDVYLGCSQVEVKTDIILANPLRWLDLIEDYKVTLTWSPNFGYKLVSDWLTRNQQDRSWDLSSLRYCMNAGEQVTLSVIREFLRLTEPFGLSSQIMQPSFGMAETCTCITYQNDFNSEMGVYRFEKSSLARRLTFARSNDARAVSFVDLGPPIPGVQIRITDIDNQLIAEGVIGRLQVKGAVITPGYYKNPAANAEALVGDGWFNTGDLGFILNGRLTLTGREKENIIINGANYYCYEIEDVVNTIVGVEPTFVGSCSIEDKTMGTEGLAIFFTPTTQELSEVGPLLSKIRSEVVTHIGINPASIVPLSKSDFPKTTSGKIQRTQMKKSLLAGDYDHILKQLDLLLTNQNTLPNWFFHKSWQRRQSEYLRPGSVGGTTLILLDTLGFGAQLTVAIQRQGHRVICIEAGTDYSKVTAEQYIIEPQTVQHYRTLLRDLQEMGQVVTNIIHLWSYGLVPANLDNREQVERAHDHTLYSLLSLTQAFTAIYGTQRQVGLYVVASSSQYIDLNDELVCERATASGFIKTVAQEMPWFHCRHIDLPTDQEAQNLQSVLQELKVVQGSSEVAYRDGIRLVPRLTLLDWTQEPAGEFPLVQGGFYILSGGLGGVGIAVARYLLQKYQARVLLLGRTQLPERSTWASHIALVDAYASRIEAFRMLEQLEGEIFYAAVDICDQPGLTTALEQAEQRYQRPLDGIFHLAGVFKERLIEDECIETLAEEIQAKVSGTWALHQLVLQRPKSLFVAFSSANGFFGGVSVGAYSAANSFLDSFVHYQRRLGLNSYCFAWSTWDETGMSATSQIKELSHARGYYALKQQQALISLEVGLHHTQPYMLVGLASANQNIRRYNQGEAKALQQATVFIQLKPGHKLDAQLMPANYNVVQLLEFPLTQAGEVDLARLIQVDRVKSTEKVAPRTQEEQQFTQIWQDVLGISSISIHDNFFSLGGDSILSLQIVSRANQAGLKITPRMLFQHQTIARLAAANASPTLDTQIMAQQEAVTGPVPLTPIQCWFFEQQFAEQQHWNQAFLLKVQRPLDPELLKQAFDQILHHHDALRMRFVLEEGIWVQTNQASLQAAPFEVVDLSHTPVTEQSAAIEKAAIHAQASLDLTNGPVVRAIYFGFGKQQPARFLLICHHLVVDGLSWRILLEDLQTAYEQLNKQEAIKLPAKTTAFQYWSRKLYEYAQSEALQTEHSYWLEQIDKQALSLPVDHADGLNTVGSTQTITLSLTEEETRVLLQDVPEVYHTQINDILLTALMQSFMAWTGQSSLLINLEGHGREEIIETADISRTVGWFTSLYPVQLDPGEQTLPGHMLKHIKELLRRIPRRGIGYGLLRYLTENRQIGAQLSQLPQAEVSFNYLGQFDQMLSEKTLFGPASESGGALTSPAGRRQHLLDIFGIVGAGQLHMSWTYSQQIHHTETIQRLAQSFMQSLRSLITHCQQAEIGGYTLSDFPLATLTADQLDSLMGRGFAIEAIYPLSPLQQGLLFHTLYAPHNGDYITQISCLLQGTFNQEAFGQAWQLVVNHHPALRTALSWEDLTTAQQIVYRQLPVHMIEHDWRQYSEREQVELLNQYLHADRIQGFDLAQAPLMRFYLFRLRDDAYRFVWSHHHILLDGWSVPIIFRDVFASYASLYHSQPVQLIPARPYQDYIQWLLQQDQRKAEMFWQRTLEGFTTPTVLGLERSATARSEQSEAFLNLSEDLTQGLQQFARQHQLTLNTVVQSTWSLLLSRYSGQDDIVFGATVAGRPAVVPGIESIVGMFINTIPVRVRLQPEQRVSDWLRSLQDQQSELLQYEHSSLAQVQNWSAIPRGSALFNSIFVFENYPFSREALASSTGLGVQTVRSFEQTHYPLTMVVIPEQSLRLKLIYKQDVFTAEQMERLLDQMCLLLESFVRNPEQRLADLPALTKYEQQLVHSWNETPVDYPTDLCMHQMFEAQAERTPAALAAIFEHEEMSYADLQHRSDLLAVYLQERGVGPNMLVGLCMERSLEMLVGMLGILKSGGVYVPMDPVYPQERLAFILRDAQVSLLLTQESCQQQFVPEGVATLCLDRDWPLIVQRSSGQPLQVNTADDLAYVIYTSGSTGQPKGVCIAHRSAAAFLHWAHESFTKEQLAGTLASTSICFDLSIFEIFVPLSRGGTVILAQNALQLPALPACNRVTLINTVPSAIAALQRIEGIPASVKVINLAGEPLQNSLAQQLYQLEHVEQVYNLYGPTEDTTYSTWALIQKGSIAAVPIGRPISNTQVYLLDQHLRPVPLGVSGELYLSGDGLAQGYLRRPALTAERFVPHPFGAHGARLYRTGDLARYTPDGTIDYLGRIDQQIKLRGFRIELGEIEHVLMQHPAVREAVVLARQDTSDSKQLVAYIVPQDETEITSEELQDYVQKSLPAYMIPAFVIILDKFPLTPNGKIDRLALPAPERYAFPDMFFPGPASRFEVQLMEIWQQILGDQKIGLHDNFFALGGDSILSIQIVARARHAGIQITPKQLFAAPTIAELAREAIAQGTPRVIEAEQGLVSGQVPLMPIQHWFFDLALKDQPHWNQAILLQVMLPLDTIVLKQASAHLLNHHDALRMRFLPTENGWQQKNLAVESNSIFTVVDFSTMAHAALQQAIETIAIQVQSSLDLLGGPLLRIIYFDLAEGQAARILLVIHHLVVDAISWRILLEDLQTVYRQLEAGQTVQLPDKTTSFQQWAHHLVDYGQSQQLKQEVAYWQEMLTSSALHGDPARLPIDTQAGEDIVESSRILTVSLSIEETEALLHSVPSVYRTQIDDVLLTALALTLKTWTGQHSLLINREGHGREELFAEVDLSRTVGWFTSLTPVRLDLPETSNVIVALKAVKEQLRRMPQQGIGYGLLRYLCQDSQVSELLQGLPIAELLFNYLGQLDQMLATDSFFGPAQESVGAVTSPRGRRPHLLEVNSYITGKQIHFSWTYGQRRHAEATIARLAATMLQELRSIIQHCQLADAGGYTPSDFPLARLKQDQIDRLLGKKRGIEIIYPLSPLQQGMLFHSLYAPEKGYYINQVYWIFEGEVDHRLFEQAWQEVLQRHEILRATTLWQELEKPLQVIQKQIKVLFNIEDWRGMSANEQTQAVAEYQHEDRQRGFVLDEAPLMRWALLQLGEQSYQFIWTYHHILLDGWSVPIILRDVFSIYTALLQNKQARLESVAPFHEYIRWLEQQDLTQAEHFWKELLAGVTEATPLGIDHAVQGEEEQSYTELEKLLSLTETHAVQEFIRQQQLTLSSLMVGVWAILLSHYSGQSDVLFGTTVSGRPAEVAGIEAMVGMFINTLPVRLRLLPEAEVLSWLKSVQTQQSELRQYEHTSLLQIQHWSNLPAGASLFESLFVLENYPLEAEAQQGEGRTKVRAPGSFEQTNYPLTIVVMPGERLALKVLYDRSRFEHVTIVRLLEHFQRLITAIIERPRQKVSVLSPLTTAELKQLSAWNETEAVYASESPVHVSVEFYAAQNPTALAVASSRETLSYAELNQRANRLARYLQQLGIGAEDLVALCLERSPDLLIAMLAVLKAGAAYLPLDSDYPQERLNFLLEDAQVRVLLTHEPLLAHLPDKGMHTFCLDRDAWQLEQYHDENLELAILPEQLAYVIYTSGSTGKPKGVQISHLNLLNLVTWHQRTYQVMPQDRATQLASVAFDACVWEIWPYLSAGASLHLPTEEIRLSPTGLRDWLLEQHITLSFLPTPLAESLLRLPWPKESALRTLLTGGDRLQRAPEHDLPFELINHYGPTESTVVATAGLVVSEVSEKSPSIGRPIANTDIYVLDAWLQQVSVGVVGELYLGGASLARGYLRRPDWTAERFIANPYRKEAGARLYRTGDLVRYLPDGALEFVGRADEQVKIKGVRIELGEIEQTLLQSPAVREAVIVAREDQGGMKHLIGYVVVKTGEHKENMAEELLQYLRERLPNSMLPVQIVLLEQLPLTLHGKVDRRALQALASETQLAKREFLLKPSNQIEELLLEIWSAVLAIQQISIDDNFFALGGDSILSLQIVSRANEAGLRITLRQLFQAPTIAQLAGLVVRAEEVEEEHVEAEQGFVMGEVPLTPIQHWFFEQEQLEPQHWNQALLLSVEQPLSPMIIRDAVSALLAQHDALRLCFNLQGGNWLQTSSGVEDVVPFSVIDLSSMEELQRETTMVAAAEASQSSLNLAVGPLMRVTYFDLGAGQSARVLIVIHHLAVDGVSWRVLLDDFQKICEQIRANQLVHLSVKTTSFKYWAQRLQDFAQSELLKQQLAYWKRLAGPPPVKLPLDIPEGENTAALVDEVSVTLSTEETRALLYEVPTIYQTQINDLLLTALAQTLSDWTGSASILVNIEGHGREALFPEVDLSRTVGWFTTLYPVLLELHALAEPATALKQIKEQLRQIPQHGIGYGLLRYLCRDSQVQSQMRALPCAEVSFNYLGQFDQAYERMSLFKPLAEVYGAVQSPVTHRPHLLDINSMISGGQLQINWMYSRAQYQKATIERLAQQYQRALQALIVHCQSPEAGGYTPSDFSLSKLNQEELDQVLGQQKGIEALYPLAPLQQGLFFHTLYAPEGGDYIVQIALDLKGALNVPVFMEAWQQVSKRYAILRTALTWDDLREAHQIVYQQVAIPVEQYDWRDYSADQQETAFAAYLQADRIRGFVLDQAPLMRLTLLQTANDCHRFIWTHHHLLLDGWSLPIVLGDVFAGYEALKRGAYLPELRIRQYQDYIAWVAAQDLSESESFWRRKLAGFSTPTPFGLDLPSKRTLDRQTRYDEQLYQLSRETTQKLQQLTRQHQVTLNTVLQGAWAILLSSYSGQDDVLFGATVAGRPAELVGIESMVGLFINTLPVRIQIEPALPVLDWLLKLQEQQSETRQYEYTPLVQVQSWSDVPQGTALFESLIVFENYPLSDRVREDEATLNTQLLRSYEQTNYPLTLFALPGEQLTLKVLFATERFESRVIAQLLRHLGNILEHIERSIERPLATISIMEVEAWQPLLEGQNATQMAYEGTLALHQLFEKQVERTPGALAVFFEQEQLTYAELNARANQLALRLRKEGVGPEIVVGVYIERSLLMLVAILGILKAGGAYVPLDPRFPLARLQFMLEDTHMPILLTQAHLQETLAAHPAQVFCLDTDWPSIATEAEQNLQWQGDSENIAYVIYTSGSTGRPKGVQIRHRAVVNFMASMQREPGISAEDCLLSVTTLSFDISVLELFLPLLSGASLVLVSHQTAIDGFQLVELINNKHVTLMQATPATWRLLVAIGWQAPASLKILCGGEALPLDLAQQLQARGAELWNMYGPTETTIWSAVTRIDAQLLERKHAVLPIGNPIANTQCYILNAYLQPVLAGTIGELYIGGDGLARGYFQRPELTAERFIANPLGTPAGSRLYRTGDLVRLQENGQLEYLGRVDQQVKIRGFRIELGEIESVLNQHDQVHEAVVSVRMDSVGVQRLIAYIVPAGPTPPIAEVMQRYLQQHVPDYMVPTLFVSVEALPLTPNGKVDRRALPEPDMTRPSLAEEYIAPRNAVEEVLIDLWQEVLQLKQVGIYDNFFALGGHSLLATQLISRIAKILQVKLPLRSLFETATVAGIADMVVTYEKFPGQVARVAELRQKIIGMSAEEIQAMLRTNAKRRDQ